MCWFTALSNSEHMLLSGVNNGKIHFIIKHAMIMYNKLRKCIVYNGAEGFVGNIKFIYSF